LTIPHPATHTFLARLQVLILLDVCLHCLNVAWQADRQLMAASPVLVLAAMTLLVEAEAAAPDDLATDEAATAPDEAAGVPEGVPD
jgi:hypothetical protein